MKKFIRFTKIGQFRGVIHDVAHTAQFVRVDDDGNTIMDRTVKLPTITFNGTVKLHGTNAGVATDGDGCMWFQSRKGIITLIKDNAGFAFFANTYKEKFKVFMDDIRLKTGLTKETIVIFGEWCGGNIQKGVAITGMPKMFVIFAVKVVPESDKESNYYLHNDIWNMYSDSESQIFNINDFESYTVDIDFNNPQESRNEMIEIMSKVEKECPVGKALGAKDETTGEGNVWVGWYICIEKTDYGVFVNGYHASNDLAKTLNDLNNGKYIFSP